MVSGTVYVYSGRVQVRCGSICSQARMIFFFFSRDQRVQTSKCTAVVLNQTWLCTVAVRNLARWSLSTSLKLKPTSNIRFANRLGAYIATYCIALCGTYTSVHVTALRMQKVDQQVGREGGKVQDNRASCENSTIFLYLCRSCSIVPALQQNRVSANRPSMHPSIYFLQLIRGLVAVPAGLAGCSSHPSHQQRFPAPLRRP